MMQQVQDDLEPSRRSPQPRAATYLVPERGEVVHELESVETLLADDEVVVCNTADEVQHEHPQESDSLQEGAEIG